MYAQKQRKQFSYLKTREMAQNKDNLLTSEMLLNCKLNASDNNLLTVLAIYIEVLIAEKTYSGFLLIFFE